MVVYLLFTSPASFERAGRDWAKVAMLPAAGTGPFRITQVRPREAVELAATRITGTATTAPRSTGCG